MSTGYCREHEQSEPCEVCASDVQAVTVMPRLHPQHPMTDREMWIVIRAGLLGIVKAYETFGEKGPLTMAALAGLGRIITVIEQRYGLKPRKVPKV